MIHLKTLLIPTSIEKEWPQTYDVFLLYKKGGGVREKIIDIIDTLFQQVLVSNTIYQSSMIS